MKAECTGLGGGENKNKRSSHPITPTLGNPHFLCEIEELSGNLVQGSAPHPGTAGRRRVGNHCTRQKSLEDLAWHGNHKMLNYSNTAPKLLDATPRNDTDAPERRQMKGRLKSTPQAVPIGEHFVKTS